MSTRPIPAPRTKRAMINPAAAAGSLDRRKPLVWTGDEFNLTELIDSVEKNIEKLERLERTPRPKQDLLELPLTEEILSLPGFKPRAGSLRRSLRVRGEPERPCLPLPPPLTLREPRVVTSSPSGPPPALPPKQKHHQPHPRRHIHIQQQQPLKSIQTPTSPISLGKASPKLNDSLISLHQRLKPKNNCVTNVLYARRLPSPPVFRRTSTPVSEEIMRRQSKDDSMISEVATRLTSQATQPQRKLYCPLCTQTFGYSFGLECHLLSVHFAELTDLRSKSLGMSRAQSCPCCRAQFLKPGIVIRHLVYHHPDFVTDTLLAEERGIDAGDSLEVEYRANHVLCKFCGQQFLRRHQKLLMLHIEQKHVEDLQRILYERRPMDPSSPMLRANKKPSLEVDIMMSSPTVNDALDKRLMEANMKIDESSKARRELRFSIPEVKKNHYYEIIEDMTIYEEKENNAFYPAAAAMGGGGMKRERSSEEESSSISSGVTNNNVDRIGEEVDSIGKVSSSSSKIKQVKKRVKRIESSKNAEKRRSLEVQELLRIPTINPNPFHVRSTSETATFCRPSSSSNDGRRASARAQLSRSGVHAKVNPDQHHRRKLPPTPRTNDDLMEDNEDGEPTYRGIRQPEPPRVRIFSRQTSAGSTQPPPPAVAPAEQDEDADSEASYGRWTLTRRKSIRGTKSNKKNKKKTEDDPSPSSSEQKLFKCNLCDVAFLENGFLLMHLKNQHRNNVSKAIRQQYSCGVCPAKFYKNSFLVKHAECHQFELVVTGTTTSTKHGRNMR